MDERKQVTIYTDGGCDPNPGPGGYGVVLLFGAHRKELSGGFRLTTNNRMEILAVIKGLDALKEPCQVTVYSDSKYLVDAHATRLGETLAGTRLDVQFKRRSAQPSFTGVSAGSVRNPPE